jgi:hypothetical protein
MGRLWRNATVRSLDFGLIPSRWAPKLWVAMRVVLGSTKYPFCVAQTFERDGYKGLLREGSEIQR